MGSPILLICEQTTFLMICNCLLQLGQSISCNTLLAFESNHSLKSSYLQDKDGNPPGIIRDEEVDEIPEQLRMVIKRLVRWRVLPSSCIPDSCIVNIYDEGDCIPPHIDHHDFLRPFCTLSLVSECNIVFGSNLKIVGPGDFQGSISIPLPTG